MKIAIIFACASAAALSGCVTTEGATNPSLEHPNLYGCCFGQGIVGNKNSVIVSNVWNEMDAFALADKWCAKYGRSARFSYSGGYRAGYDCLN
jgi:hypothetical protein